MTRRLKMAIGLGATCSGCDMTIVNLSADLPIVDEFIDFVFWPTATDMKLDYLKKIDHIDVSLYHGFIRTDENEEIAKLLREKSDVLVSFGACACFGGIPGMANAFVAEDILREAYVMTASTDNPKKILPTPVSKDDGRELTIPKYLEYAYPLDSIVDVDYYVPGCPPPTDLVKDVVLALKDYAEGGKLPKKGTVFASNLSQCHDCTREKPEKIVIEKFHRIHEVKLDPNKCFLAQGVICMGPATRSGCDHRCINVNLPCRGCFGPLPGVKDQGAKMISVIGSLLHAGNENNLTDEQIAEIIDTIPDPMGTFYRFSLPSSILGRKGGKNNGKDSH